MRVRTFTCSTPTLALFLGCAWLNTLAGVNGEERIVVDVEVESEAIPTSKIPLPPPSNHSAQKPSIAPFDASNVTRTFWNVQLPETGDGNQKPLLMISVLSDWKSMPLGVVLPSCDVAECQASPIPTETGVSSSVNTEGAKSELTNTSLITSGASAEVADTGVGKPEVPSTISTQEVVQVKWIIQSHSEQVPASLHNATAFNSNQCPLVVWPTNSGNDRKENSAAVIETMDAQSNFSDDRERVLERKADQGSPEQRNRIVPDHQVAADLESLLTIPENRPPATYLSELNELLQGESNWIFGNEGLLDLAPEEGERIAGVSYLDDLNKLLDRRSSALTDVRYRETSAYHTDESVQRQLDSINDLRRSPNNPYTSIEPDRTCSGLGGVGVASLFRPLSDVRLNGLSSAPPSRPRDDVSPTAELPRPEDKACAFMDAYAPVYYATPFRTSASRPNRNTHAFYHRPLYYEDPNLERCGKTHGCLTTAYSTVHFMTAIAFTPYLTGATHPTECVQSLPDCPTCHCFDCRAYWPGWSWNGAVAQAAAVTGLYFAFVP